MLEYLKGYDREIYLTLIIVGGWLITRFFVKRAIKNISLKFGIAVERRRITVKVMNVVFLLLAITFIVTIWGVDKKELFLFFTSIITVLGIGFFAQWSILSNITSGIIIFFSHPIKLGDNIRIVEKDFFIEGKLVNISFFFIHLINEQGESLTVPNSIALQKTIIILKD